MPMCPHSLLGMKIARPGKPRWLPEGYLRSVKQGRSAEAQLGPGKYTRIFTLARSVK
jgi:hypothetical protein